MNVDVIACSRESGLDISGAATSKRNARLAQARFNAWGEETGLSFTQISRIRALSTGENRAPGTV